MNDVNTGVPPQAPTSHMMQTTKRGRPFLKVRSALLRPFRIRILIFSSSQDTLDLFATLIVSLDLGPRKQFFRIYENCFSTYVASLFCVGLHDHLSCSGTKRLSILRLSNFRSQIVGRTLVTLRESSPLQQPLLSP